MKYKDKDLCRIRTVTAFLILDRDRSTWKSKIFGAAGFCNNLSHELMGNGYLVQSIRIVTNPFGEYLNTESIEDAKSDLEYIRLLLTAPDTSDLRIRFALGEATTKQEISLLPELISEYGDLCNACVNAGLDEFGVLDNDVIHDAAVAVSRISRLTPRGEGNFNFTVNFNCAPLIPYFPAGYHRKELGNCFVVGLETPDLLRKALEEFNETSSSGQHFKNISGNRPGKQLGNNPGDHTGNYLENSFDNGNQNHNENHNGNLNRSHNALFKGYHEILTSALQYHINNVVSVIDAFSHHHKEFSFAGIDSSAAPSKNCSSMVEIYKLLGVEYFGASGTVEASAFLTRVFKSIKGVNLTGFSGLMLAVTEDKGLAEGTKNNDFDIRSLLTYSAVCGIGLDTVPIPGDTAITKITALMRDTGTMAYRLNKPLTVRLFPVPGLKAGDLTAFESDDLCNCAVLKVP